jgi:hypothetical protein
LRGGNIRNIRGHSERPAVVEQWQNTINNPKIVALNPSVGTRRERIAIVIVSSYSTVVEPLTSDREVVGSAPAFNCH